MPVTVVGVGAQVAGTGATLTPTYHGGYTAVANDCALVFLGGRHAGTVPALPANWSLLGAVAGTSGNPGARIYARILAVSETLPAFTLNGWAAGGSSVQCMILRGTDLTQATIEDATEVTQSVADTDGFGVKQPTGITTATFGSMVVQMAVTDHTNALFFNTANGYTLQMGGASYDTTLGDDHAVGVATKRITAAPGAQTSPTWEQASAWNNWCFVTVAIKPGVIADPTEIIGLAAWFDATDGGSISGANPVTAWADRSGAGAGSFTATSDPNVTAETLNGLAVMQLDGGDYFINTGTGPFLYALGDFTAFAVARVNNTTGVACILGEASASDANPTMRLGSLNGDSWFEHSNNAGTTEYSITSVAADDGAPHLFRWVDSTTVASLTVDGGTTVSSATYARSPTSMSRSGIGDNPRGTPDGIMSGYIAEIVVYNSVLTAADVSRVETYLTARWLTGGGSVTGTVAVTLGSFTSSASGTATPPPITGTVAVTLGPFAAAASGTRTLPAITGTTAVTLAPFVAAAAGTHTPPAVTGTVAVTLSPFISSASGTATGPGTVTGTVAVTLGPFVGAASGTRTIPSLTGTVAVTLGSFTSAATGTVIAAVTGTATPTLGSFTSSTTGIVNLPAITGTVAVTLGPFVCAAVQTPFGGHGVGTVVWRDGGTGAVTGRDVVLAGVGAQGTGTGTVQQP